MKLKKLFTKIKQCKPYRDGYQIKWNIRFEIDDDHYNFAFLPTITYVPWIYRYPNIRQGIIDIWWLNIHILIGEWGNREEK